MEASVFVFKLSRLRGRLGIFFPFFCLYLFPILSYENDPQTYLLQENHPIKPVLDSLFSHSRASLDVKSMKKAGFIDPYPRKFTRLVVTRHPLLEGYVIKLYLDAQRNYKNQTEFTHWCNRIQGANLIRQYIQTKHLTNVFKVPDKWIYRLPDVPTPPHRFNKKNYILICEDMNLLSREENIKIWASEKVTLDLLSQVYEILNELGLHDCGGIDNIPFCEDGKIAFIDTESYNEWPVNFKKLTPFLSPKLKSHWKTVYSASRNN